MKFSSMAKVKPNFKTRRSTFIRQWRKHRGLTLDRLADRIGVTAGALSQLERGDVSYTQSMLEALADALSCEPADLLMRDPTDPEGIWSIWDQLEPPQKRQAIEILSALKRAS
jgi:transcriptional regulator with XRE-family HTH domain